MKPPFIRRATHDAALAAKDALIDSLDKTAAMYCAQYKERGTEIIRQAKAICDLRTEVDRLRRYEPARDPVTQRFVGKAVSNG